MINFSNHKNYILLLIFWVAHIFVVNGQTSQQKYDSICKVLTQPLTDHQKTDALIYKLRISNQLPTDTYEIRQNYRKIIQLSQKQNNKKAKIQAHYYYANQLICNRQFQEAKRILLEAKKQLSPDSINWITKINQNLSSAYQGLNHWDSSLIILHENTEIITDTTNYHALLTSNWGLAKYYNSRKEYTKSLSYFSKALYYAQKTSDKYMEAEILNLIGCIYYNEKDNSNAIDYFYKSNKINESINNLPGLLANCINMGLIQFRLKNYDNALFYYQKALNISTQTNCTQAQIACYLFSGNTCILKKEFPLAIEYLNKAQKIAANKKSQSDLGEIYVAFAKAYMQMDKIELSKQYLTKAHKINYKLDINNLIIEEQIIQAQLNLIENKPETSERILINIIKKIKDVEKQQLLHALLADIYTSQEEYE